MTKWREFGSALRLRDYTLELIRIRHLQDAQHCLTEVLAAFLKGEGQSNESPPNWKKVVGALKSVNMNEYAEQLIRQLTGT